MAHDYRARERVVRTPEEEATARYEAAGPVVEREVRVERPAYVDRRTVVEPDYVAPAVVEPRVYLTTGHQVNRIVWYLFGLLEGLLALRFVLRALGANPANGFAQLIYGVTAPFVALFRGLVSEPAIDGAALEITTLIAMFVYLLVAIAVTKLIQILSDRTYDP